MEFPPSELILHPDGSIYHLHLKPEDISDLIITVGDPDRVALVSAMFDSVEVKKAYREFVTHTGYVGKRRISVLSTGIGTDNIDIVLNELDALVNIDLESRCTLAKHTALKLVRIGTSGSMQADIPVDSFLVSSYGIGIDSLMNFYAYQIPEDWKQILLDFDRHQGQTFIHPYIAKADKSLDALFPDSFYRGITLTCPGFYAPQGRQLRYQLKQSDYLSRLAKWSYKQHRPANFEMETAAIYAMAHLLGHQALSLNAIIANRATQVFSEDGKGLVVKLIEQALSILETA